MKKVKLVAAALFVISIVWGIGFWYVYAKINEIPSSMEKSPRAVQNLEPGDYAVRAFQVRPTENSSEWICEVYYKDELLWNWSVTGTLKGELSKPLNRYIEEAIRNQGWWIKLNKVITFEMFISLLPESDVIYNSSAAYVALGIYKYNQTYYSFEKIYSKTRSYYFITPHDEYVRRHMAQIQLPTVASGVSIAGCWIALGAYKAKKRKTAETT